ncbi:FliM/FliN family flagellar motor switch protein [Shewanella algae]|uniref:FliM/FliN family flagellar motor switch protein n=1 Tax=Shewanella algae TaxID=38313 RepID=UPI0013FDC037|nr:FliM/FliN family flagellar motor switch protein [Shewanella algae]
MIRTELTPGETQLTSCNKHYWFAFRYQRKLLGLLRIDRCTLEQLASSYYGGQPGQLYSPLGAPTQSEFRLGLKLMRSVLESLPFNPINPDELQIELSSAETQYKVVAVWSMSFPDSYYTSPMLFAMTDELLGRIGQAAPQYQQADNLKQALEQQLTQIPVKLKLELGWQALPVQALAELQHGEIIPLNLHLHCPVSLGELTLFYGTVHSHQGKLVARLNQDAFQQNEDDQNGWTNIAE